MFYKLKDKYLRREWTELSWGELFDKISILRVKLHRMTTYTDSDSAKMSHVVIQYEHLYANLREYMTNMLTLEQYQKALTLMTRLYDNNYQQWDYENAMSTTGDEVPIEDRLEAMKNSYTQNRGRAIIKREIDELFNSKFIEIKQYDGMKNEPNTL